MRCCGSSSRSPRDRDLRAVHHQAFVSMAFWHSCLATPLVVVGMSRHVVPDHLHFAMGQAGGIAVVLAV
jgi:hypothetical protein